MGLASIIISVATKEIAGFTVMGYLTEKAADIGTGKIWTELKREWAIRLIRLNAGYMEQSRKVLGNIFTRGLRKMYPLLFVNVFLTCGAGKDI